MKRLQSLVLCTCQCSTRQFNTTAKVLRGRFIAYDPHRKATDPAKQDPDYYEKAASALSLDEHYVDNLGKLYADRTAYERDLRFKSEDNLLGMDRTEWLPNIDLTSPKVDYVHVDALRDAPDAVKRIFSVGYGSRRDLSAAWKKALISQVQKHDLDHRSLEMRIAWLTTLIRHWSLLVEEIGDKPRKPKWLSGKIFLAMGARRKLLRFLRENDAEAFEKLLSDLKIAYRVPKLPEETVEKRRKAWVEAQLTERVKQEKEKRLGALYEKYTRDMEQFNEEADQKLSQLDAEQKRIEKRLAEIAAMQRGFSEEKPPKYQPQLIGHLHERVAHTELFYLPPPNKAAKKAF